MDIRYYTYSRGKLLVGFPLFILGCLLAAHPMKAQVHEVGGGIGATNYSGDLARGVKWLQTRIGANAHYKYNKTETLTYRAGINYANVAGTDANNPIDPWAQERNASFNIHVFEVNGILEYYFLDYKGEDALVNWSPYFFIGVGAFYFLGTPAPASVFERVNVVIPIGMGFKYVLNPYLALSGEFSVKPTFTDNLDAVVDTFEPQVQNSPSDRNLPSDRDLYYYSGVSLTYTFHKIPCPYHFLGHFYN